MSALGQKLPRLTQSGVSALPPKAAADVTDPRVRFGPKADIQAAFRYYCWWARVLKFVEHQP